VRLYQSTNGPRSWPAIASLFAKAIFDDDPLPLFQYAHSGIYTGSRQSELSRVAVGCADSPPVRRQDGVSAERMADEIVRVLSEVSPHFGGSVSLVEPDGQCEFWPQRMDPPAGFRFTGTWNATLKQPMLVVGNTADPITPLTSAREINQLMGDSSRLIIQDSPGHCSLGVRPKALPCAEPNC
jgi:pimeloyl-ACP methyl ester carboxylesterase